MNFINHIKKHIDFDRKKMKLKDYFCETLTFNLK